MRACAGHYTIKTKINKNQQKSTKINKNQQK